MHRRVVVSHATIAVFILISLSSVSSAERVVSLGEAIALSLQGNHGLRAAGRALEGYEGDVGIARSFLLPHLVAEERFMRTANPTYAFMAKLNQERFTEQDFAVGSLNSPRPINDFQTSVSFEQAVFAPKAFVGLDMAKEEHRARSEELMRKKDEVAFSVFKAYIGVQTARAFAGASEKGVEEAREHLRIAEARLRAGLGLHSDKLRAEVSVAEAEERMISARKNLLVARRALGLALGLDEAVDATEERPSFEIRELPYYYEAARSRRDLVSMEARQRNAAHNLRLANAGYLPMVGIGGTYQVNDHRRPLGTEGDSWQVMAFLRWELFDGTKREHERNKALAGVAEAEEYSHGLRKHISFQVYEAFLGVEESAKGLELARKALQSAEEGRRLVKVRYENSLSAMVDLLDVQTGLDAARASVAAKEGGYLVAVANLWLQSGTILKDLNVEKGGGNR